MPEQSTETPISPDRLAEVTVAEVSDVEDALPDV